MRKLYEIDQEIENLIVSGIDPETGELMLDESALEALQMEREQKIESVILYRKDLAAEMAAIKAEIKTLQDRYTSREKLVNGLDFYLTNALDGKKFSTARCEASFRRSESVEPDKDFCQYAIDNQLLDLINCKETVTITPDRVKIKAFLKSGGQLEHCKLVEKQNISIK